MGELIGEEEEFDRLRELTASHMVDLVYTYKAFFKMARWSHLISKVLDALVIIVSLGLLGSLVQGALPDTWNVYLAAFVALGSVIDRGFNFNKKGHQFEQAADSYNSLYKEIREFHHLTLLDKSMPTSQKKERLQQLTERHRELNELTPSTWDIAYRFLDEEDVLGNVEITEEEHDRIL
ncbi:hypothetical protein ACLI4R_17490 [Natrialbaceae archaeon A-chndr2]